jgi:hypothetical protein
VKLTCQRLLVRYLFRCFMFRCFMFHTLTRKFHDSMFHVSIFLIFFVTYFTAAQYIQLWQYGRHLCDSPSRSTRVSAYHGRPEPQQRDTVAKILTFTERHIWYYCLLAAKQGNYVHGLCLEKKLESFSLYRRKNYHDPLRSLFVGNF